MSGPLRVLLVEDSPTDAKMVIHELKRSGREVMFDRVEDADAMRAALQRQPWDLVLSDWAMPKFSAPAACALLKKEMLDIPFIIVSGTVGEDVAVEAMRNGAHDYVLKERLGRLMPAIERELRECEERRGRRNAEVALRQSEEAYRQLFEGSPLPMYFFDEATLAFRAVNEPCLELYGYTRSEFLSRSLPDIRTSTFTVPLDADAWNGAAIHHRKDGSYFNVQVVSRRVVFGGLRGRLAVVQDVTQQQRLEDQLRQAQKMEAVGRLAGGIAHDFNNALSVILSYSAMLLRELPASDPAREDLQEIKNAGDRAAGLTRQLLTFSRQQMLQPRVLDLNELLGSMDKMLRRILGEDVQLVSVPALSLGTVRADLSSLEQVIMNLVVNARDAMPTGGKLTIETANVMLDEHYARTHLGTTAGPHVMLAVTDSGTGIPKETQARIFEPFFTTKEQGKGTGLGLSTAFGIVKQSGGSIWVYSEPGHGTTFKIFLPRVDAPAESLEVSASGPAPLRGTETILLVEDEDAVRVVAHGILKRQGYRVIEARNAGEALLLSEKHTSAIDLLVTDVVMPQMSGPELAGRLLKVIPGLKVLCMSGYTDDTVFRHGVLSEAVAFLQKPFTPETLAGRVRDVLDAGIREDGAET